jgi:hypothetical protein
MRRSVVLLLTLLAGASRTNAQVGALQTDCDLGGVQSDGSYQFVATCAGRSRSPDGRFAIVQKAYRENQPPIELQDSEGRIVGRLLSLSDDMPFSVSWAPNSRWFFVNHHVGSFMDRLQIFQIMGNSVAERRGLAKAAVRVATKRFPCLPPEMVLPNGIRWAPDSRRIVLITISAPYACKEFGRHPGTFHSLWMIGNIETGRIDRPSIRVQVDDQPLRMPRDGPYSHF